MAETRIPRWVGIVALLAIAVIFGSNHISARVAFEHGANVTTAVAVRSVGTALFVLALLAAARVPLRIAPGQRGRVLLTGLLIAVQSYCIYSSVARIPVALALLAFNTHPMMLALISWFAGGERPAARTVVAMPIALAGLALALDVWGTGGDMAGRWGEIGAGVLWATAAAASFAAALYITTHRLQGIDGRLRTFWTFIVTAALTLAGGALADDFALPASATGWVALALLTVFYGTAITSLFLLLPRLGAVNNAMVLNFEPIAVLALAWVILGQSVTPLQIVGAFVVVGAIMALGAGRR